MHTLSQLFHQGMEKLVIRSAHIHVHIVCIHTVSHIVYIFGIALKRVFIVFSTHNMQFFEDGKGVAVAVVDGSTVRGQMLLLCSAS